MIRKIESRHSLILLAPQGGGKGTFAKVAQRYGYHHIESGQMLRDSGRFDSVIKSGSLVASKETSELVRQKFLAIGENQKFIFDGYPRDLEQCHYLYSMLKAASHEFAVVQVMIERETAKQRALTGPGRGQRGDEGAIEERHQIYYENIGPICRFWSQIAAPFHWIDNNGAPESFERHCDNVFFDEVSRLYVKAGLAADLQPVTATI